MKALLVLLVLACALVCDGAYTMQYNYSGPTFFDNWSFYTDNDPTHGYVNYISEAQARTEGLISAVAGKVIIGSDDTKVASGRGRDSIRLNSMKTWNAGLFLMDLSNMPAGCGTWPAWWLVGPNWPNNGEIDIIEGVNANTVVSTTLHTSNNCMMNDSTAPFTGTWGAGSNGKPAINCFINAPNQYNNQGCGITGAPASYGAPFNSAMGGVYVTEWTTNFIQMWFFPRNNIPKDITSDMPNPMLWGKPYAYFGLGGMCNPNHFQNMNMVIDLTFCGDWAGGVFGQECPGKGSCQSYVQNNPKDFSMAYWQIAYIKVFQM
jgi:hypothetical protein